MPVKWRKRDVLYTKKEGKPSVIPHSSDEGNPTLGVNEVL
jgi:hypothetical protein